MGALPALAAMAAFQQTRTKVCLCEDYKFSSKLNAVITLQDLIVITFSQIILLNKKSRQDLLSFQMIWSDMAEQLYFDIAP